MPRYSYKAINPEGQPVEGELNLHSAADLDSHFLRANLTPVRVEEQKEKVQSEFVARLRAVFKRKLLDNDLIAFTRQFAAAYGAGLSISKTLRILAAQTTNFSFRAAVETIAQQIESGKGLTESFRKFPHYFEKTYVAILHSGEISGNLDVVLNYSAGLLEKKLLHRERIKSTLLYPKLVLGMVLVTSAIVVVVVIPQFAKLYNKFETKLPLPTRMLVALSEYVQLYWWSFFIIAPLAWLGLHYLRANKPFMLVWDEFVLKVPILGITFLKIELTHFSTTFALLLRSGIKVTEATQIAIDGVRNSHLRRELSVIVPIIEQGGTLSKSVAGIASMPPLMASMIAIGEETGRMDELLDRVAALYENETELLLKKLPTLLEPVVLGFLFVLVGLLALAVYLPLWKMASVIKGGGG